MNKLQNAFTFDFNFNITTTNHAYIEVVTMGRLNIFCYKLHTQEIVHKIDDVPV